MKNELPDPEEFARYLEQAGIDAAGAALDEGLGFALKVIDRAAGLKGYAYEKGFSYETAEGLAVDFWNQAFVQDSHVEME